MYESVRNRSSAMQNGRLACYPLGHRSTLILSFAKKACSFGASKTLPLDSSSSETPIGEKSYHFDVKWLRLFNFIDFSLFRKICFFGHADRVQAFGNLKIRDPRLENRGILAKTT